LTTPPFIRTPDEQFDGLPGYPFQPAYLDWNGLRMHYVDHGPREGRPVLLVHGEPTWSYLYRGVIARLADAGYRCIAPDFIGFGRSDKVIDDGWYVIERHVASLAHVIESLDLQGAVLVCQDWGGPIGLRQAADQPERFAALVILNTWLHHDGYAYTEGIKKWRAAALDPAVLGGDMPTGRIIGLALRRPGFDRGAIQCAYDAPFTDAMSKAGPRRFPWCLPFAQPIEGNAGDQQRCFDVLTSWPKPAHVIFGDSDQIFTMDWAREWASKIAGSTLDAIAGAGHFVQEEAPDELADVILRRLRGDGLG
jgi:haloalkane dehalogenase